MLGSHGGVRKAGKALGLSPTYVSRIMRRESLPSVRLAEMAGWRKEIKWVKV
jgi:hypothetical protein